MRKNIKVKVKENTTRLYSLTLTLSELIEGKDIYAAPVNEIMGEVTYLKRAPETLEEETILMLKNNTEEKILLMAKSFGLRSGEYFLDIEIDKSGDYYDSDECEVEINMETNTATIIAG